MLSDVDVRSLTTGTGAVATIPIPFDYESTAEVKVYGRDESTTPPTITLWVSGNQYNISGTDVVTTSSVPTTTKVLVIRSNALTQSSQYNSTGVFNPDNVEEDLDRAYRVFQELDEKVDRAPLIPLTSSLANLELPEPEANKVIGWNASGTGFENFDTDGIAAPISNADVASSAAIALSKLAALTASRALVSSSAGVISVATLTAAQLESLLLKEGTYNIGLAAATTTNANDSIKITGATAALSSTNPGLVVMMSATTPGLFTVFTVTADVTLKISGAPFGFGGKGDITGQKFAVYAINDAGTLKWGAGLLSQITEVDGADDEATVTSANTAIKVVVSSALSATSPCLMVGRFLADFDDTGGAVEDNWALQSSIGDFFIGREVIPIHELYESNASTSIANSSAQTVDYEDKVVSSHGTVTVGSSWGMTAPVTGLYSISASVQLASAAFEATETLSLDLRTGTTAIRELGRFIGQATVTAANRVGGCTTYRYAKGDVIRCRVFQNSGGAVNLSGDATANYISIHYVEGSK